MQLNVKIDDEIYKAAKVAAKKEDIRLRHWIEEAIKTHLNSLRGLEFVRSISPAHYADGATGGKDDCAPPPEAHVKARGKKRVRGAKKHAMSAAKLASAATEPTDTPIMKKRLRQYAKEAVGGVRPKIDIARLLP